MMILSYGIGVVSLVCWIVMLVKIFQSGNVLMGVLSICPLVCFVYGWVKVNELKANTIMLVWTVAAVLNIILRFTIPTSTPGVAPYGGTTTTVR